MNTSKIAFLIDDTVRAFRCAYEPDDPSATNSWFKSFDQDLEVDDLVVVESTTRHGMTVAKIVEADADINFDTPEVVRWIVAKIDVLAHSKVIEREQIGIKTVQTAEKRAKREELRAAMIEAHGEEVASLAISHDPEDAVVTEEPADKAD